MEYALSPLELQSGLPPGLLACLPAPAARADHRSADTLPAAPGAYLLVLCLEQTVRLDIATLPGIALPAGWYVYAGSARGPGGLRARLARHLRRDARDKPHWHIDRLTPAACARIGLAYPQSDECALIAGLMDGGDFNVPVSRFGASDCRACESHLLRWRQD